MTGGGCALPGYLFEAKPELSWFGPSTPVKSVTWSLCPISRYAAGGGRIPLDPLSFGHRGPKNPGSLRDRLGRNRLIRLDNRLDCWRRYPNRPGSPWRTHRPSSAALFSSIRLGASGGPPQPILGRGITTWAPALAGVSSLVFSEVEGVKMRTAPRYPRSSALEAQFCELLVSIE